MWGFAHLVDLLGASFVTWAPQKGKGVEIRHNVPRAFKKHRRRPALLWSAVPRIDTISAITPIAVFVHPK
jgi:hypothetical protein